MTMRHRLRGVLALAFASLVVLAATARAAPDMHAAFAERLRDARTRVLDGDPHAGPALEELARTDEGRLVADVLAYLDARAAVVSDPLAARERLEKVLASHAKSPIATRTAADLLSVLPEDTPEARIRALVEGHASEETALRADAARLLASAGSRLRTSNPAVAARFLMSARERAPGSDTAKDAASALDALRAAHPALAPDTADAMYVEARLAGREERFDAQRAWLERFLARYPNDARRTDALLLRSQGIARESGREAAASWLEARAKADSKSRARAALLYAAATHRWNLDQDAAALTLFDRVVSLRTAIDDEQRAYYSIGRIREAAGEFEAAAAAYRRGRVGGDGTVASESRWREGWAAYLAGSFGTAAETFSNAAQASRAERPRDAHDALLYWQARSLEKHGDKAGAEKAYRELLSDSPDSFYAYLAEKRTGLAAQLPERAPLAATSRSGAVPADTTRRIGILNRSGFSDLASVEVARLLEGKTPAEKLGLLPGLAEASAHAAVLKTALDLYGRGVLAEAQLYAFLYPAAFETIVQPETGAKALDPYLVYALMKQESLFDPHAVSSASAIGLMQLLPSTARRLALVAGEEAPQRDDLFDPQLNIRLGVAYLAELAVRFHNDPVFILASYNAGEKAADSWKGRFGSLELDELVEHITYRETRQYVKKVLGNYRNYLRLYADLRPAAGTESLK